MYSFKNDYSEGAHPRLLQALIDSNLEQLDGYGEDRYSKLAKGLIRDQIGMSDSHIYFISGGTHANLTIIASMLMPYESVISAHSGHINVFEAGAVELCGHKINTIPGFQGKIVPSDIQSILDVHENSPHMVKPKMVYISNSTEMGTIYSKNELENLFRYCKEKDLFLFLDGARLGSALCSHASDVSLADIARNTDIFYIGGTKNGALLGEAIVINNEELKIEFNYHLKQRGGLMAKGRVMGVQFYELFRDGLFYELATHANQMAKKMADHFQTMGYQFLAEPQSNQLFPILPQTLIQKLSQNYLFFTIRKIDESHSAIRLVTSWATSESAVDRFIKDLEL